MSSPAAHTAHHAPSGFIRKYVFSQISTFVQSDDVRLSTVRMLRSSWIGSVGRSAHAPTARQIATAIAARIATTIIA